MTLMIDKYAIIERIKEYKNISSDAELARFLGISPTRLANWRARNTIDYDLIFTKCEEVNLNWLITGSGVILKSELFTPVDVVETDLSENGMFINFLKEQIKEKEVKIEAQAQELGGLKAELSKMKEEINKSLFKTENIDQSSLFKSPDATPATARSKKTSKNK